MILFGLPGSGKTFVGEVLQRHFGYHFYDGDTKLTEEMINAIDHKIDVTDSMRNVFFNNLSQEIRELRMAHKKLALAQTFIKEKYRELFLRAFPDVQFILVETETHIRENRLSKRVASPLDKEYARKISRNFEIPKVSHYIITNNVAGEESVKAQITSILS